MNAKLLYFVIIFKFASKLYDCIMTMYQIPSSLLTARATLFSPPATVILPPTSPFQGDLSCLARLIPQSLSAAAVDVTLEQQHVNAATWDPMSALYQGSTAFYFPRISNHRFKFPTHFLERIIMAMIQILLLGIQ